MSPPPPHTTSSVEVASAMSNSKASLVFTYLQYWVHASRFEPNEAEMAVLAGCEQRAARAGTLGGIVGAAAGVTLARNLRQPTIQLAALGGVGGLIGSIYGQYSTNLPCICDLLALGDREASPLAAKALHLIRVADGGLGVSGARRREALASAAVSAVPVPLNESVGADAAGTRPGRNSDATSSVEATPQGEREGREGAAGTNSWDEVRRRYQQSALEAEPPTRSAGARDGAHAELLAEAQAVDASAPRVDSWEQLRRGGDARFGGEEGARPRGRKNRWGDETFD